MHDQNTALKEDLTRKGKLGKSGLEVSAPRLGWYVTNPSELGDAPLFSQSCVPRLCHPSTGFQSHRIGHTSGAARGEESPVGLMQSAIDSCPFHLECCLFPNYIGSLLIRPHRNKM